MNQAQVRTKFHHYSIHDLLNRSETLELCYDLLELYQQEWRKKHKRGGIVSSVYDVLQAILSLMPKTMEDMKKQQPAVFEVAVQTNSFFCFANCEYLAAMLNKQKNRPILQITGRTVRSCINKLLDAKILSDKVNFELVGTGYPQPIHEDPKGRGKFKLILNKEVLVWGKTASEMALGEASSDSVAPHTLPTSQLSFPQMITIQDNKDSLEQSKTPIADVDKASANAEKFCLSNGSSERESNLNPSKEPNVPPKNFQKVFVPKDFSDKDDFFAQQLFEQARVVLWNGQNFNTIETAEAVQLMKSHLGLMKSHVEAVRKQKIVEFRESQYFLGLSGNPTHQNKIFNWFSKRLPDVSLSAVRILSEAIQKQYENAKKNDYLKRLYRPTHFFVSSNWTKALDYSKADWGKLYTKFSDKNRSLGYYQYIMEHINKAQTATLEALNKTTTSVYAAEVVEQHWQKLRILIANAPPEVTNEQKDRLIHKFKNRIQPIFSNNITKT